MFWNKKNKPDKSLAPRGIPEFVLNYLASENKISASISPFLKAVMKVRVNEGKVEDVRIFDPADAEARKIVVRDYDTLTQNPALIIGEGWIDPATKKVDIAMKIKYEMPKLFTEAEILQQIESLQTPGSSVFFFMAAGAGCGGPLARGGALVRLNDNKDEKKKHKYLAYGVNIIDGKPAGEENFIFETNKSKEVAKWFAQGQRARFC
jgi:hypothetical protein